AFCVRVEVHALVYLLEDHFVPALLQAEDTIKPSSEVIDDASDLGGDLDDPVLHDETPHVKSDQCGDGRLVIDADRLLRVESLRSRRHEPSGNGIGSSLSGPVSPRMRGSVPPSRMTSTSTSKGAPVSLSSSWTISWARA